jgi:hypothetical protein
VPAGPGLHRTLARLAPDRAERVPDRILGNPDGAGYVVRDVRRAMAAWIEQGVGPWLLMDRARLAWFRYRDADSPVALSIAVAACAELQIVLIQQTNYAPSLFRDFLDSGREGLHHLVYSTTEYEATFDEAIMLGNRVTQEGSIFGERGRFAYMENDVARAAGILRSISEVSGPNALFFKQVRALAARWDGTEPIRRLV